MAEPAFELTPPDLRRWREGNTGTEGVWRFEAAQPGPHVAITALIHGNELAGAWALAQLLERLDAGMALRRGRLTLAFCNLRAFERFDAAKPHASRFVDEDLNRQWSPERLASGSTAERRRAAELRPWLEDADDLLDLHSMHEEGSALLLTGTQARHVDFVRDLGLPGTVVIDAGHAEGKRMRDFGRFGLDDGHARSVLIECGYHGNADSRRVAQDAVHRLLVLTGMVHPADLPPAWRLDRPPARWALEVTDAIVAETMEFRFAFTPADLQCIERQGTVIGYEQGREIVTPYDDCVLVMPSLRQLRPGVTVVRLARRRPMQAAPA
jgi:predicted deacylase